MWERYLHGIDIAGRQLDADTAKRLAVNRASAWGELRVAFDRRLDSEGEWLAAKRELMAAAAKLAELPVPLPPELSRARERRRLLVVADRTLDGPQLRAELCRLGRAGTEFHIVAPIFAIHDRYNASDTELGLERARERLRDALHWASKAGLRATGTTGDPNMAMGAIADELRRSGADEILVATLPRDRSNWLRNGVVERLKEAVDVDVATIEVDLRVHVTVQRPRPGRPPEPETQVVPTPDDVRAYLKGRLEYRVYPADERGRIPIGIFDSPKEAVAAIERTLAMRTPNGDKRWVGVVVTAPPPAGDHRAGA